MIATLQRLWTSAVSRLRSVPRASEASTLEWRAQTAAAFAASPVGLSIVRAAKDLKLARLQRPRWYVADAERKLLAAKESLADAIQTAKNQGCDDARIAAAVASGEDAATRQFHGGAS